MRCSFTEYSASRSTTKYKLDWHDSSATADERKPLFSGVTAGERGADRPGWHPPGGWHPKEKNVWANLQRIVGKRGRIDKKSVGWHPPGGDTRVKSIKKLVTVMSKKSRQVFQEKNRGVTPSVAAPGVTQWRHWAWVSDFWCLSCKRYVVGASDHGWNADMSSIVWQPPPLWIRSCCAVQDW